MTEIILIVALSMATMVLFILLFAERAKRNKISDSIHRSSDTGDIKGIGDIDVSTGFFGSSANLARYLKLKNCDQLIPELLKKLKDDGRLSKLGFYLKTETSDKSIMSVKLNIKDDADTILRENHEQIVKRLEADKLFELNDIGKVKAPLENSLRNLKENGIRYLTSIPWLDNKRAVLALGGSDDEKNVVEHINRFQREALPLVENIRRFEKAEELSNTDSLTGTYNLRYFTKRIGEEFQRARRYERFLALMIIDIDELKIINDKYGHLVGDTLINSFVTVLSASVRSNDIICRYGGDEFCLIMPEIDRESAQLFMERIRDSIAGHNIKAEGIKESLSLTVSIGGAVFPVDSDSIEGLIRAADMALLKAKQEGRNCSKLYQSQYDIKS
jgi:diguanylate cyclase (GGDEF)-like protein